MNGVSSIATSSWKCALDAAYAFLYRQMNFGLGSVFTNIKKN